MADRDLSPASQLACEVQAATQRDKRNLEASEGRITVQSIYESCCTIAGSVFRQFATALQAEGYEKEDLRGLVWEVLDKHLHQFDENRGSLGAWFKMLFTQHIQRLVGYRKGRGMRAERFPVVYPGDAKWDEIHTQRLEEVLADQRMADFRAEFMARFEEFEGLVYLHQVWPEWRTPKRDFAIFRARVFAGQTAGQMGVADGIVTRACQRVAERLRAWWNENY